MRQSAMFEDELQGSVGFKEKIIARIMDNLQIKLERVYFRFVDQMKINSSDISAEDRERLQ